MFVLRKTKPREIGRPLLLILYIQFAFYSNDTEEIRLTSGSILKNFSICVNSLKKFCFITLIVMDVGTKQRQILYVPGYCIAQQIWCKTELE